MGNFSFLDGVAPEKIVDKNEFAPIKGAYECKIDSLERVTGESKKDGTPYDFYALNTQVKVTVEGDKGDNRFLKKSYQNDEKGIKKMRDDMFTAGLLDILNFESNETLDPSLTLLKDKMVKIRAYHFQPKDRAEGDRVQVSKLVAEFDVKGVKGTDKSSSSTPF